MKRGKAAKLRLDRKSHSHNLFWLDLVTQIGHVRQIENRSGTDESAPTNMPPDKPLRLKFSQYAPQLISGCAQPLAQFPFRRKPIVVPVPSIVDQVPDTLRKFCRLTHVATQFADWLID